MPSSQSGEDGPALESALARASAPAASQMRAVDWEEEEASLVWKKFKDSDDKEQEELFMQILVSARESASSKTEQTVDNISDCDERGPLQHAVEKARMAYETSSAKRKSSAAVPAPPTGGRTSVVGSQKSPVKKRRTLAARTAAVESATDVPPAATRTSDRLRGKKVAASQVISMTPPPVAGNLGYIWNDEQPGMAEWKKKSPRRKLLQTWDHHPELRAKLKDLVQRSQALYQRMDEVTTDSLQGLSVGIWADNVVAHPDGHDIDPTVYPPLHRRALELAKVIREKRHFYGRLIWKYDFKQDFIEREMKRFKTEAHTVL